MADDQLYISNYAVAFIDLLGQRDDMRRYRTLPNDKGEAIRIVKESVGKIASMHDMFQRFYDSFEGAPSLFESLSPEQKAELPSMNRGQLHMQRFSDGLVVYTSLAEVSGQSPINSVYGLISAAGSLALIHLAAKHPVRIGVDIGWGIELWPGELYGAALAHAYELESQVAQWPRAVVGTDLKNYLEACRTSEGASLNDEYRRIMANECIARLAEDLDGPTVIDFAGPAFLRNVPEAQLLDTIEGAKQFVDEQLAIWSAKGNVTLAGQYQCLQRYLSTRI